MIGPPVARELRGRPGGWAVWPVLILRQRKGRSLLTGTEVVKWLGCSLTKARV